MPVERKQRVAEVLAANVGYWQCGFQMTVDESPQVSNTTLAKPSLATIDALMFLNFRSVDCSLLHVRQIHSHPAGDDDQLPCGQLRGGAADRHSCVAVFTGRPEKIRRPEDSCRSRVSGGCPSTLSLEAPHKADESLGRRAAGAFAMGLYGLLVPLVGSFTQPFTIMMIIPMALIGTFYGFYGFNMPFYVTSPLWLMRTGSRF